MLLSFRKEYFEKGGNTKDEEINKAVNLIHNNKDTGWRQRLTKKKD